MECKRKEHLDPKKNGAKARARARAKARARQGTLGERKASTTCNEKTLQGSKGVFSKEE
jgi:hypothetical protein